MTIHLPPELFWRFRALCGDLAQAELEHRQRLAAIGQAKALLFAEIALAQPNFDKNANWSADDETCTLTKAHA